MAEVCFKDVSVDTTKSGCCRSRTREKEGGQAVLSQLNGRLPAGSMTLILSPPGHGKTSFMRALAGRLPVSAVSGSVSVDGTHLYPAGATAAERASVTSSVSFLEQTDAHLHQLTVRETLLFAARNVLPPGCGLTPEASVEGISSALGLGECLDTQVGSDTVRGISGGQRRRLSIAECLLNPSTRLLCLDEATTGLDAAVALTLLTYIRHTWARGGGGSCGGERGGRTGATVVAALLQPTPEICALFDQVICLQHGRAVYIGPPAGILPYLQRQTQLVCPPDTEPAEYAVQCLTTVKLPPWKEDAQIVQGVNPQLSVRAVEVSSDVSSSSSSAAAQGAGAGSTRRRRGTYALSLLHHTHLVVAHQAVLVYRDGAYLASHLLQATLMGLLLGSLFYMPDPNLFNLKISVVLFAAFLLAFNSMPEVNTAAEQKRVVLKHARQGLFPPAAYALASTLVHIPVCAAESAILGSCVYWMVGYYNDSGRAAFFLFVLFLCDLGLSVYFRALACALPSQPVAEALAAPSTGIFILFSGFLVTRLQIPNWLIWLYYLSPFSWMLRSISQAEFLAPIPSPYGYTPSGLPEDGRNTFGVIYLNVFQMQVDRVWMWAGVAYLAGFLLVMVGCVGVSLSVAARGQEVSGGGAGAGGRVAGEEEDMRPLQQEAAVEAPHMATGHTTVAVVTQKESLQAATQVVPVTADRAEAREEAGKEEGEQGPREGAEPSTGTDGGKDVVPSHVRDGGSMLAFEDLRYTIPVPVPAPTASTSHWLIRALWAARAWLASALPSATLATALIPHTQRTLLDGITAYAAPGTLTAVMGASGAGKSTLFDVLMGLKTVGAASGRVWLDGVCAIDFGGPRAGLGLLSRWFSRAASLFHTGTAGYVQQSDLHEPTATVLEALRFSAALRLPPTMTTLEREAVVQKVMGQLELTGVGGAVVGSSGGGGGGAGQGGGGGGSETVVGWLIASVWAWLTGGAGAGRARQAGSGASLSPGQRKRLTIAVELVAQPKLLLLDEPTSGLDAREAAVVMRVLRRLATEGGLTVLATIHQPSSEVFSSFDQLLLLAAGGRQVYFGPVKGGKAEGEGAQAQGVDHRPSSLPLAQALLTAMPTLPPLPPGKNPASWCLECLESVYVAQGLGGSDGLQSAYRASAQAQAAAQWVEKAKQVPSAGQEQRSSRPSSCARLLSLPSKGWHILLRDARASLRGLGYTWARLLSQVVVALLFGALFWRLQRLTAGGAQTALAVWWMSLVFVSLLFFSTALPQAMRTRAVTHRETVTGMYPAWMAGLCKLLVEVPWVILTTSLVSAIVYGMVGGAGGLSAGNRAYGNYWLCMTLLALTYNSMGHWFAAWLPTLAIAQNIGYLGQAVLFLFGGLFVPLPSVPPGWLWLVNINPLRYAAHSVWSYQFFCDQDALDARGLGERCSMFTQDPLPFPILEWEFIRAFLGLEYSQRDASAAALVAFLAVYTAAALLTLQFVNHIKR